MMYLFGLLFVCVVGVVFGCFWLELLVCGLVWFNGCWVCCLCWLFGGFLWFGLFVDA